MTQSDLVKVALGAAVGAAIAAALVITIRGGAGGKTTRVTLSGPGGSCTLGKETKVRGKVDENLTWKIENYCSSAQTVAVGNFRTSAGPSSQNDCSAEGPDYPFDSGNRVAQIASGTGTGNPGRGDIKLKVKNGNSLPGGPLTYYFDICIGSTKADPELAIER
jgi:hypothetical protein